MNIRSIKKRNQLRLKRSVGRSWSSAAIAIPIFLNHLNEYRDWLNQELVKAFSMSFLETADPETLASFKKIYGLGQP
jgi:hypothetical protein